MNNLNISPKYPGSVRCRMLFSTLCTVAGMTMATPAVAEIMTDPYMWWMYFPVPGNQTTSVTLGNAKTLEYKFYCKYSLDAWGEIECHDMEQTDSWYEVRTNDQALECKAVSNGVTRVVPFDGNSLTVDKWSLELTNSHLRPIRSPLVREFYTNNQILFKATNNSAHKNLVVTCNLSARIRPDGPSIGRPPGFPLPTTPEEKPGYPGFPSVVLTFKPAISAEFSVVAPTTSVSHRTKDEGIHIYKLDFSNTLWYNSRTIKYALNLQDCGLTSASATLHYDNSVPNQITGSNYDTLSRGTSFNLQTARTPNPSFAYFRLRAKRSSAGAYSCNATLTQSVD